MMCVMLIILLLAVVVGSPSGSKQKKQRLACQGNLQKIYLSLTLYSGDNRGDFPLLTGATNSEAPLSLLVPRDTTDTGIFICPASGDKPPPEAEPFTNSRISYAYYMGRAVHDTPNEALASDWQVNSLAKRQGQALFSSNGSKPGNNHGKDGGNLLLDDGSLEFSGPAAPKDLLLGTEIRLLNPLP